MKHEHFLKKAIDRAESGMKERDGGPFGAIIVKNGEIIGRGNNQVIKFADPTAHAEVMAIRDACKNTGNFHLDNSILYTTCEPCPMCLGAAYWAKIEKIYFGCSREDAAFYNFNDEFIYMEIGKSLENRSVEFIQLMREESLRLFKIWDDMADKINY